MQRISYFITGFLISTCFLFDVEAAERTGGFDIAETWRFKLNCGRDVLRGFFSLKLDGSKAEATFASISRYPNVGFLNTKGTFDKDSGKLELKSDGFPPNYPRMVPVDITAQLQPDALSMKGSAQGAQKCPSFKAWTTEFDTRRNPKGIIPLALKGSGNPSHLPGKKHITIGHCEKFIDWFSKATVIDVQGARITSVIVDSSMMLDVLGFTYDTMNIDEGKAFGPVTNYCVQMLKNSPNTAHARLLAQYDKVYRGIMADQSPYMIGNGGLNKPFGNGTVINYYWYHNMYYATAVRDGRRLLTSQLSSLHNLPHNIASLEIVKNTITEGQSKDGVLAALPEADKQNHISKLVSIQSDIASGIINNQLASISWNDYEASLEGLAKLNLKQQEIKKSLTQLIPDKDISMLDQAFETKRAPLSSQVTDQLLSSFPGIPVSLDGLRGFSKTKKDYLEKYRFVLITSDFNKLITFLDQQFSEAVASASPSITAWLEEEVPANTAGIQTLNEISMDIVGTNISKLAAGKYPQFLRNIAQSIQERHKQIKKEACVVPKGFEEMREVICAR